MTADKRGLRVFYRLADSNVLQLWHMLRSVGETQLAEIDRLIDEFLGYRDDLDAIGKDELLRRIEDGTVVVVDARPYIEYRQGHIAGALSIPIEELTDRLKELPENRQIVAYCRGPYCVYADDAVRQLRRSGRRAARLEDGYPEWARAGLPVAIEQNPEARIAAPRPALT